MVKRLLVTGAAGLIGGEACRYFAERGWHTVGVDNNLRRYFFGDEGSTDGNLTALRRDLGRRYEHHHCDIRDAEGLAAIVKAVQPDAVIHTAAQPSHDWAAREPMTDFAVNATGTLNLLEAARQFAPEAPFIFTSTNKVYGDRPNQLPFEELNTRWELPPSHPCFAGVPEDFGLDQTTHSLFGVSKTAADLLVQEYGRYFRLSTVCFRGGCLTGPTHAAVPLHGFLAYLVRCIQRGERYTIHGHRGKQVRDNIHSRDLIRAFAAYIEAPRSGEVYNIGGSRHSNISMSEAIAAIEQRLGKHARTVFSPAARIGDHQWYISDVAKFRRHYPDWDYQYDIDAILDELCASVSA